MTARLGRFSRSTRLSLPFPKGADEICPDPLDLDGAQPERAVSRSVSGGIHCGTDGGATDQGGDRRLLAGRTWPDTTRDRARPRKSPGHSGSSRNTPIRSGSVTPRKGPYISMSASNVPARWSFSRVPTGCRRSRSPPRRRGTRRHRVRDVPGDATTDHRIDHAAVVRALPVRERAQQYDPPVRRWAIRSVAARRPLGVRLRAGRLSAIGMR
jgi:hypothetical protein